ncbi:MAG: hypothetical protein IPM25_13745 [Chloracidobacterium sp.]|nr:hypothetical protein [Chloracidobacterium sp.]
MRTNKQRTALILLFFGTTSLVFSGCGGTEPVSNTPAERVCAAISDTPGEAYKRLFAAVKEKDTEKIRGTMSKLSQEFAQSLSERQNKKIEEVYANGFTASTFSPTLPEVRDERVAGCWAGVEVWNAKDQRWEDLPYINEDGEWKLAVGEMFRGTYTSPGKPMAEKEREAANVARGNQPVANMMTNAPVSNVNVNTNMPKYDGPQVAPLPKR